MTNKLFNRTKRTAWKLASNAKMLSEFLRDYRRYAALSTPSSKDELSKLKGRQLECQVTKDYHRIEKGLSISKPKRPFGLDPKQRLDIALSDSRNGIPGQSPEYLSYADSALEALELWNLNEKIDPAVSPSGSTLPKFEIDQSQLQAFFTSRRSIRSFDPDRALDLDVVRQAIRLAGHAPSVCNRQSWKTHLYTEQADIEKLLSHQSGNRGFGHTARGLLVVTADARLFSGSGERNQRWVDGGLFAMSIVWAMHGLGINSCMLNWSKGNSASEALRRDSGIAPQEDIIVMIALGYAMPDHRVARSPRRPVTEIFRHH
ncbi:nitroreductase family protein [Arthrobacter sp. ZBG10]|uniref:nitroreductase family protein n=1 Tax=Arthrobacter sp. ZBG10 TaxID=1676590 RepID=UPI0009E4D7BA|nr:nitroreductase family protein [Arthrobacter sp. ZBG10]